MSVNMRSKEIAKVVGLSMLNVGFILKKQVNTGKLENGKRAGKARRTSLVNEQIVICMVKKNPLMTEQQVKNALQDAGGHVSFTIFTTRCKPLVSLKNRKTGCSSQKLLE